MNLLQRGLAYGLAGWCGEIVSTGLRSHGRKPVPRHWRGLVRPPYAPVWAVVGLGAERLHGALDALDAR